MEDWKIGRLEGGNALSTFQPSTPPVLDGCDGFHKRDSSSTVNRSADCIR